MLPDIGPLSALLTRGRGVTELVNDVGPYLRLRWINRRLIVTVDTVSWPLHTQVDEGLVEMGKKAIWIREVS